MNILNRIKQKAQKTGQELLKKAGTTEDFNQKNLKTICNMYISTLGIAPMYATIARSKLVSAIQEDVRTLIKQGRTKDYILSFYNIDEFNKLWQLLKFSQRDLEVIIDYEIDNFKVDQEK